LTTAIGADATPAWSPDGTQIAFVSHRDDPDRSCGFNGHPPCQWAIYVMNADGSNPHRISALHSDGAFAPDWQPLHGPQRSDYKNAAQFCKAERDFLGDAAFTKKYGGGANAYGKCVSAK
jgi:hypothetical protein